MTRQEVLTVLKNELECIKRQDTPRCNRDECGCQGCDLIIDADRVTKVYEFLIENLEVTNE